MESRLVTKTRSYYFVGGKLPAPSLAVLTRLNDSTDSSRKFTPESGSAHVFSANLSSAPSGFDLSTAPDMLASRLAQAGAVF